MWTTTVQNNCAFAITANGNAIPAGQSLAVDYVWTGVSIQLPGIGQIQALEAGSENPGPNSWAVKLVSGNWFAYWGYEGTGSLTVNVFAQNGQYYFSVPNGGPSAIAVQRSSPDNVFPAASIWGDITHDGVNLLTGDVNQSISLGTITDGRVSFGVSLFYNSKSAALGVAAQDNVVAGSGWRLVDYPKIVQEGGMFYFLDGACSYLLALNSAGGGYVSGNDYHAWRFINAADGSSWTVTDDQGFRYVLANKRVLGTGRTVWHLSTITDTTWTSSIISVTYNGNSIATVANTLGDALVFAYDASGCLSGVVHGVVTPQQPTPVGTTQVVLGYSAGTPKQLVAIQTQQMLPTGGGAPADAGYLFQYYPATDPIFPFALSSVQTPMGATMTYTYYAGNGIAQGGVSIPFLHPVVSLTNLPQPQQIVAKGLYFSFWCWAFDPTQTYAQFNLAKEYAGGVYSSVADESPDDPYGHTSYLFFTGQPASSLIYYNGDAAVAADPSVLGSVYWTGNFEIVRTVTVAMPQTASPVGGWPGTLIPLSLPAGALVCGASCVAQNGSAVVTDMAFDLENNGQQIQGVYQTIGDQSSATLSFQLHLLGAATHVRAWSYTPTSTNMQNLTVTYVLPPPTPPVPPITTVQHWQQVVVTGYLNPVAQSPGNDFSYTPPYERATSVLINFWNKDGGTSTVVVTCYDGTGAVVGTGTFQASSYRNGTGTVTFASPSEVARINVTATSGNNVGVNSLYLTYQRIGQPITDDALAWELSNTASVYQIGRPGVASFAKTASTSSSVDGVSESANFTWGDDNSLPYPVTISQTVVKPDQGGSAVTVQTQRQITYAVQEYPALAYNNVLKRVAQVIDSAAPAAPLAAVSGGVTQWMQWGNSWDEWRQYQLMTTDVTNGFAPTPDDNWTINGIVLQRNARGLPLVEQTPDGVTTSRIYDGSYGNWRVANFVNADVTQGQAGWIGFEAYEAMTGWSMSNGTIVANQAYTGAACYQGSAITVAAALYQPRPAVAYQIAAYVRLDTGAQCVIGFCDDGTWSVKQTIAYDPDNPGWVFAQAIMPQPAAGQRPTITVSSGAIDHVVFAPVDADYESSVWTMVQRQMIAGIGPNGAVTRIYYDTTGNDLASATPGRRLSLINQDFFAILGQLWFNGQQTYNVNLPNQSLAVRAPQDGDWDDFSSTSHTMFPAVSLTNMTLAGNHLLAAGINVSSGTAGVALAAVAPSASDFVVCAEIIIGATPPAAGQAIGLTVRRPSTGADILLGIGNGTVALVDLASGLPLQSTALQQIPPSVVLTLVVRGGTTLYAYADGMYLFSQTLGVAVGGPIGVRTTWPGSACYNFGLISAPELSNSSQDGDGTEMQFLTSTDAASSNLSQNLYGGNLQLYAGRTLPTTQTQASLAPVSGFATLNADSMTVTGSVTAAWPNGYNTSPFADSVQHFSDPVLRTKSRGRAGIFTAGNEGAVTYAYGEDDDAYFDFPKDELNTNVTNSPTGARIISYSNRTGTLFGKARIDTDTDTALLTGYEYDTAMRSTAIYFPAAYSSPTVVDKNIYFRKFTYDFIGNLNQSNDSDAGVKSFAYDTIGRQRLTQDAVGLGAPTPYCVYTKYDSRSRVIESGTWPGLLGSVTQAQLDDPTWPQQGNSWHAQFTWDSPNEGENNSLGRMTAAATPAFTQWYLYDQAGMPTKITNNASFLVTELKFGYDDLGRLTSLAEATNQYDVVYGYDEQGRMISVGSSSDPVLYASYTYGNGTITETLLKGVATRTYTMNALGDLQSIADEYFTETLYFETRQSGQPGYLNGQISSAAYGFVWTGAPQNYVYDYSYDNFGRLTSAINSVNSAWNFCSTATPATYDSNGNMLTMSRGGQAMAFTYATGCNQLENTDPGATFGYDANGNVTGSPGLGITNITYSPVGLWPLSAAVGSVNLQFVYDAKGRKVQRLSDSQSIVYLRDDKGRVLCEQIVTVQGTTNMSYIYGLRGRIAMIPQGTGIGYALLSDHGNSVRVVVDNNRNVAGWYNYDPFGQTIPGMSSPLSGLRYLYAGQEWDGDLNLYDFAARLYDPEICRFYAIDPDHQFASPYIYSDNPVSYDDPTGEWFLIDDIIATVGGALIGGGLELAREAIAGESISWKKIGIGAAVGAVVGEAALYTAGGSVFIAGGGIGAASGAALGAAALNVGTGMAIGAGVGAALGGVQGGLTHAFSDTGQSLGADIGWGILGGLVSGAQTGMVSAVVAPAAAAKYLGRPIAGAINDTTIMESLNTIRIATATGAIGGGVNSLLNSLIQQRSLGDAALDFGKSVIIGAVSGRAWNVKNTVKGWFGFGTVAPTDVELRPILGRSAGGSRP